MPTTSAAESKPLTWEAARDRVHQVTSGLRTSGSVEQVTLLEAHGRILAVSLSADRDYPALRRSLRDGFAIHAADIPGTLKIRGEIRAGDTQAAALPRGEALEIMTGAPLPAGADAVVMVENVMRHPGVVEIPVSAEPDQFINPQGAEAKAGQPLIPAGTRLDASHIATLAMAGHSSVAVRRRASVAILATGDEIVSVDTQPEPHQIRNSNSYMLASLVRNAGGDPHILPVAADNRSALTGLLEQGLTHDMLLVSGGVSAGKYDLVKPCLRDLGVHFAFERVRIQPGQPTAFGTFQDKPVFGLPGNPGSTLVTFQVFAQLALALISGESEPVLPFLTAVFAAPFRHKLGLTRFLPAHLAADGVSLRHIPWQGSSDVPALARANVFLIADHDRESWSPGDSIRVMPKP